MSVGAYDEILAALVAAGARFVLIGGLALNAWGVIRGTKDVDVVIARDPDNARAVEELAPRSVSVELGDLRIDVCSREDLRAMKRGAGRPQDLVDLENLDLTEG